MKMKEVRDSNLLKVDCFYHSWNIYIIFSMAFGWIVEVKILLNQNWKLDCCLYLFKCKIFTKNVNLSNQVVIWKMFSSKCLMIFIIIGLIFMVCLYDFDLLEYKLTDLFSPKSPHNHYIITEQVSKIIFQLTCLSVHISVSVT